MPSPTFSLFREEEKKGQRAFDSYKAGAKIAAHHGEKEEIEKKEKSHSAS